jgi:glycosyltransferase involved in cell wall biosynthesis
MFIGVLCFAVKITFNLFFQHLRYGVPDNGAGIVRRVFLRFSASHISDASAGWIFGMIRSRRDYVVAVQAPACSLGGGIFATESAFAIHLKELRAGLPPRFDRLVVLAPAFERERYDNNRASYGELSEAEDGIIFVPAFKNEISQWSRWFPEALGFWKRLGAVISTAGYVHAGLAPNIWRPYLAIVNLRAWLAGIPTLFVVDIDFRNVSRRFFQTGVWSKKSYVVNCLVHDPFKSLQVWLAVRASNLILLKSPSMVAAFGRGRVNVKDFLDAAHSAADVVSDEDLERRLAVRQVGAQSLSIIYFGRFVSYKGLDFVLDAIEIALARGARVHLTLVGSGDCLDDLRRRSTSEGLRDAVTFLPTVKYGAELFALVDRADVAVAAPKVEDTPRAALDAMARGLPIVAFDIDYFKNLSEKSGAVALAEWPSPRSLADQFVRLQADRAEIAAMSRNAVAFARANTQEIWLRRRGGWTMEFLDPPSNSGRASSVEV